MEVIVRQGQNWIYPTLLLCSYGFLKDMKPSEPFLTPFLNSTYKNLDVHDLSDKVYPIWTYSYLVFLFIVFLFTDFLRYKPMIIIESLGYLATRIILIWGEGIPMMQLMQVVYGLASAAEIAYYSYIYTVTGKEHYRKTTSYVRTATLLGRGFSDLLGQILISTKATNYLVLNYISLGSVSLAVLASLFLPSVKNNIFLINSESYEPFENVNDNTEESNNVQDKISFCDNWKQSALLMVRSFRASYSNKELLMWSLWWALAMCGGLQVENYVMNLWADITGTDTNKVYNGAVFAAGTISSALFVFLFSLIKVEWNYFAQAVIAIFSFVDFAILLVMSRTTNIWIAYGGYVLFRTSYAFILTIASFQIALHVQFNGYGLIFGWNTFIALCLQTLLTFVVTDEKGLDLGERDQFLVYACYFGAIGLVFVARPTYHLIMRCCFCIKRYTKPNVI